MTTTYQGDAAATLDDALQVEADGDPASEATLAPGKRELADRIAKILFFRGALDLRAQTPAASYTGVFFDVDYGPDSAGNYGWIAVGGGNAEVQVSLDGVKWGQISAAGGYTNPFSGVASAYGAYAGVVLTGTAGMLQEAAGVGNALSVATPDASFSGDFNGVRHLGGTVGSAVDGRWFAVGDADEIQERLPTSGWTRRSGAVSEDLYDIAYNGTITGSGDSPSYNGTRFVAVGLNARILTADASPAGSWTARTAGGGYTGDFRSVIWTGTRFVAVGYGYEIQTSDDGITWTHRYGNGAGTWDQFLYKVAMFRGLVIAVGEDGGPAGTAPCGPTILISADHGLTWTLFYEAEGIVDRMRSIAADRDGADGKSSRLLAVGDSGAIWRGRFGGRIA